MKRDLFRQMKHEWIDNVWLVVGLAIVSLTVWWFSIVLYNKMRGCFIQEDLTRKMCMCWMSSKFLPIARFMPIWATTMARATAMICVS